MVQSSIYHLYIGRTYKNFIFILYLLKKIKEFTLVPFVMLQVQILDQNLNLAPDGPDIVVQSGNVMRSPNIGLLQTKHT